MNQFCDNCNSDQYIRFEQELGSLICINCGLIISNKIPDLKEERIFEDSNQVKRHGGKVNYFKTDNNIGSRMMSYNQIQQQYENKNYKDVKYDEFVNQLKDLGQIVRVPSTVVNKSIEIYERLEYKQLIKKAVKNAYLSAIFFMAASSLGFYLSPGQISDITGCKLQQMYGYFKKMKDALQDIQIQNGGEKQIRLICQKLELGDYIRNASLKLGEQMMKGKGQFNEKYVGAVSVLMGWFMMVKGHDNQSYIVENVVQLLKLDQAHLQLCYSYFLSIVHTLIPNKVLHSISLPPTLYQ